MIEASDQPEVYAIDQGTVLFAGNDRKTNKTVVIQHPDRTKSTYGFLAEINVRPYQFIQANQEIGVSSSETPVDRKSTRLNSSHVAISYAVFCLKNNK